MLEKVTYFDVEYANTKNKSICQIGLMSEQYKTGEPVYPELDIYINPEDGFDDNCIKIHGITRTKIENEPNFVEVWPAIEKYFTNAIVIGHNVAAADIDALVKALKRYNLDIPELYYICTLELAREYVPRCCVSDYGMSSLCEYFDIDIDSEHNAFDDACACSDLFKALVKTYDIDIETHVKRYDIRETKEYSAYISDPVLRKSMSEFYGMLCGFTSDNRISHIEHEYIKTWLEENKKFFTQKEMAPIFEVTTAVLEDGKISEDELKVLINSIKEYLDNVSTSPITLATQTLAGILKGIVEDEEITEEECVSLREWLYDNQFLSDHFPFDKALAMVERVLEDGLVTDNEMVDMRNLISDMLDPVESLRTEILSVAGKHICLSGNFAFGSKSKVEEHIVGLGGIIESSVKKATDILIVGDYECQAYSNGTYGTKVKKALEYNKKGSSILIVKESDVLGK